MTELFIGALAAFFLWTCLRFILPFKLPDILALLAYGGIAYGVLCIPVHRVTLALAWRGSLPPPVCHLARSHTVSLDPGDSSPGAPSGNNPRTR